MWDKGAVVKKILGYTAFLLVMGGVFLYLFFPSDGVREYFETAVARMSPRLSVRLERIRPALPFGVALENPRFHHESEPGIPVFSAETIRLFPSIQTILKRRPVVRFSCVAYGGNIEGIVSFDSFDMDGPIQSDVRIDGLSLAQYPLLGERLKRTCTGVISGAVSYRFHTNNLLAGRGNTELTVRDGTVGLVQPVFGLETLRFERIDLRMDVKDQRAVVNTLLFRGDQLNARGEGTVRLNSHFGRSILDIMVALDPAPGLWDRDPGGLTVAQLFMNRAGGSGQFRVRIHGTIAQPRFQLP